MTSLVTDADGVRGSEDVRLAGDDEALDDDVDEVDGDRVDDGLFIWLIIRLIQLVFSAETVFFSHKKSANSVFQPAYNSSRTAPTSLPRLPVMRVCAAGRQWMEVACVCSRAAVDGVCLLLRRESWPSFIGKG
jgi:hypothetical protein